VTGAEQQCGWTRVGRIALASMTRDWPRTEAGSRCVEAACQPPCQSDVTGRQRDGR
jgi:hypothetical protein